ncbi:MAG: DoxX family membrane protein [Acidobacteriota bacterium]|nr:DoxX family membrane protein [Acidobacteriota bacterium]
MTVFFLILMLLALLSAASKIGVNPIKNLKDNARIATGLTFIFIGATHFLIPDKYLEMMPPFVPSPLLMVYLSGFFEILGGAGLILPNTKRIAAYGLTALLLAVFPANVYVALNNVQLGGFMSDSFYQWFRLPLQFVLIWWVLWTISKPRIVNQKATI